MKLWMKIVIALVLGMIVGYLLGPHAAYLKIVGDLFLRLINMIVIPLVFSSMTVGITSIHDPQKLGRVGIKTLLVYLVTMVIAILFALSFGMLIKPGAGLELKSTSVLNIEQLPSVGKIFLDMIPSNPIQSMSSGNVLQVIVFSIFLGIAINFAGTKGKPVLQLLEAVSDVMLRLTSIVMEFAPFGVFAIMAWVSGTFGFEVIIQLAKFLLTYYLCGCVHILVVFCGILWFLARLKPLPFFRGSSDALLVAFSTCSSSATLPVMMHCAQANLGVPKQISSFVLPLGSTVNMNGAAMFQGMAAIFVAQAYGIDLTLQQIALITLTATLAAIGAAGIPGSGLIMLSLVFNSVGLPMEGIGILLGVDRLREMFSTTMNVMGDLVTSVYIARSEGELNEQMYYHEELAPIDLSSDF